MKTVRYGERVIEYDENAPCIICGEPVISASSAGTSVCPWCDCGRCRYCGVEPMLFKQEIDGGRSLRDWRDHMKWHKEKG